MTCSDSAMMVALSVLKCFFFKKRKQLGSLNHSNDFSVKDHRFPWVNASKNNPFLKYVLVFLHFSESFHCLNRLRLFSVFACKFLSKLEFDWSLTIVSRVAILISKWKAAFHQNTASIIVGLFYKRNIKRFSVFI